MKNRISTFAIGAIAMTMAATPALASTGKASFTVDAQGPAATIEVQSWSWGVSNPGGVTTARETGSGMATGRRMHKPLRVGGPYDFDGSITIVSPRDSATGMASGKRACAVGDRYQKIEIENANEKVSMSDLTVMRCDLDSMTLSYASATDLPVVATPVRATKTRSNIQNN